MNTCMIYATAGSPEEARSIAKYLVSERLVACVNIIDNIASIYRWDSEIQEDTESVLIAKTTVCQRSAAIKRISDVHSYDTPCVVSYDAGAGLTEYLTWIEQEATEQS